MKAPGLHRDAGSGEDPATRGVARGTRVTRGFRETVRYDAALADGRTKFGVAHCVARLDLGVEAEALADWLAEVRLDVSRS